MPLSEKAARSKDRSYRNPQLQHRHFAFIAACIRSIPTPAARVEAETRFGYELRFTNASFDRDRFRDACGCEAEQYTLKELDLAITHAAYWLDHLQQERCSRGFAEQGEAA